MRTPANTASEPERMSAALVPEPTRIATGSLPEAGRARLLGRARASVIAAWRAARMLGPSERGPELIGMGLVQAHMSRRLASARALAAATAIIATATVIARRPREQ